MARTTFVKKAQQRYRTVPVIDPETGAQKVIPVLRKDGTPKKTKTGREITRRLTVEDKSQPLPNRKCEKCSKEIEVGQPYKWVKPKSGPYGGAKRVRCGSCPGWQQWDLSNSLSAQLARIDHEFDISQAQSEDDVTSALEEYASQVREIAEQKKESAENIREGFGHDTYQSEELDQQGDDLETWADEIEQVDVPEFPEPEEEEDCEECQGSGEIDNPNYDEDEKARAEEEGEVYEEDETTDCTECGGSGRVTPDEPTDEQISDWLMEVESAVEDVTGNCPV